MKKYERHGQKKTRLYRIWMGMRGRCNTPTSTSFPLYGARGISVCDEWDSSFVAFRNWALANGYGEELEIDRIDSDGNYEPSNCRWVTASQNTANRKKVGGVSRFKGVTKSRNSKRKWRATGKSLGKKQVHLGSFVSEEDAARAYDRWAKSEFGQFASLNFGDVALTA